MGSRERERSGERGLNEGGVSDERKFPPLPLRTHALIFVASAVHDLGMGYINNVVSNENHSASNPLIVMMMMMMARDVS